MNAYIYDYIFNYGVKIVGWENGSICLKYDNGHRYWYSNDRPHRTNGPAIEWGGNKEWYLNGLRHRVDSPALEYTNGDKYWYLNGKLHRTNGPAVDRANGAKEWWLNGKQQK